MQWVPKIGLALLASASACGFQISTGGNSPDDSMGSGSDGPAGDVPVGVCPWPYAPEYATPCPSTDGPTIELEAGNAILDTDSGTLMVDGNPVPIESEITADVRIVWTRGLHISAGAQLRVQGTLPIAIVATGAITIDGVLDGGAHVATPLSVAPGANPLICNGNDAGAKVGQPCAGEGASGGGGGGFGELGGQGGGGGDGRDCGGGNTDGMPGGAGGVAVAARPSNLRGGCPGATGGLSTDGLAMAGVAGSGGGAVALIAREALTISGTVNVGGAAGTGAAHRSGGGGGGSGGMLVLEASQVSVTTSGRVAANGGGGGGGCDNGAGTPGEDGRSTAMVAKGGAKEGAGGNGGDGGTRTETADNAPISGRGGGGGGGAVGVIRVHSAVSNAIATGSISPMPSP